MHFFKDQEFIELPRRWGGDWNSKSWTVGTSKPQREGKKKAVEPEIKITPRSEDTYFYECFWSSCRSGLERTSQNLHRSFFSFRTGLLGISMWLQQQIWLMSPQCWCLRPLGQSIWGVWTNTCRILQIKFHIVLMKNGDFKAILLYFGCLWFSLDFVKARMQDFQAKWLRSVPCSGCLAAEAGGFHLSLERLRWEGIQRLMDPKIKASPWGRSRHFKIHQVKQKGAGTVQEP